MVRTSSEHESQLPTFGATRSKDYPAWTVVTCPREDCAQTFLVKTAVWFERRIYGQKDTVIIGRPCPYCFKAARLPARSRIR